MRVTVAFAALVMVAAGASSASAQGLATADLPGMTGGIGIGRQATGFAGTMGDPAYYSGSSEAPPSEGRYSPYGTMTAAPARGAPSVPGGVPYEVQPPAMQYRFGPSSGR